MYISYSGFYFYAHTAQPMILRGCLYDEFLGEISRHRNISAIRHDPFSIEFLNYVYMGARYPDAGVSSEISRLRHAGISRSGEMFREGISHINTHYRNISDENNKKTKDLFYIRHGSRSRETLITRRSLLTD